MRLNSKLTWGLAWAGLALVVAVPSADYLTSGAPEAAVLTSDTDPVKTASIDPAIKAPASIELAPAAAPVKVITPAPVVIPAKVAAPAETVPAETDVASLSPTPAPKVAPFPVPVSERPLLPPAEPEETIVIPEDMSADSVAIAPPAEIPLEPYETEPTLRDYLVSRGLLDPGPEDSTASVTYYDSGDEYDADGFYLSDGPNAESRSTRSSGRTRLDLLIGDEGSWDLLPF